MGRGKHIDESRCFAVRVSVHGPDAVVRVAGELDLATAPELEAALTEAAPPSGGRVILDLRELSFSDAMGLRAIERASHRLGSRMMVVGPTPPVRRVLKVTELDRLVRLDADEAPKSDVPASNAAYVRRLWEAFAKAGVDRLAEIVPPDAEWKPLDGDGRVPHGGDRLAEFWGSIIDPTSFVAVGEDVLVSSRARGEEADEVWSLYRFEGRRLIGATSFVRQDEALAAHRSARG